MLVTTYQSVHCLDPDDRNVILHQGNFTCFIQLCRRTYGPCVSFAVCHLNVQIKIDPSAAKWGAVTLTARSMNPVRCIC